MTVEVFPAVRVQDNPQQTMKDNDVIVVIFSKEQVRRCKLAHFLKQFGRVALPLLPQAMS